MSIVTNEAPNECTRYIKCNSQNINRLGITLIALAALFFTSSIFLGITFKYFPKKVSLIFEKLGIHIKARTIIKISIVAIPLILGNILLALSIYSYLKKNQQKIKEHKVTPNEGNPKDQIAPKDAVKDTELGEIHSKEDNKNKAEPKKYKENAQIIPKEAAKDEETGKIHLFVKDLLQKITEEEEKEKIQLINHSKEIFEKMPSSLTLLFTRQLLYDQYFLSILIKDKKISILEIIYYYMKDNANFFQSIDENKLYYYIAGITKKNINFLSNSKKTWTPLKGIFREELLQKASTSFLKKHKIDQNNAAYKKFDKNYLQGIIIILFNEIKNKVITENILTDFLLKLKFSNSQKDIVKNYFLEKQYVEMLLFIIKNNDITQKDFENSNKKLIQKFYDHENVNPLLEENKRIFKS